MKLINVLNFKLSKFIIFLHNFFRYHIEFSIPWDLCIHNERNSNEPAIITEYHNPYCHIIELTHEKESLK